jgi:hypothetical protein
MREATRQDDSLAYDNQARQVHPTHKTCNSLANLSTLQTMVANNEKSVTGRKPVPITRKQTETILQRIANGDSLVTITKDKSLPCYARVTKELRQCQEFASKYAQAREDQADWYAQQILEIVKQVLAGEIDPQAARVAVDALKWTASKLKPRMYGDRITTELTGAHGGPVAVIAATIDVTQAAEQYRKLMQGDE